MEINLVSKNYSTKEIEKYSCPNCNSNSIEYIGRNEIRNPKDIYRCISCYFCWRE